MMELFADFLALAFLMVMAYRGFSVILFAPVAAMIPLLFLNPTDIPAVFTGVFMERAVVFIKLYFPLFGLGAVFGKLVEMSGFARSIIEAIVRLTGNRMAVLTIVLAGAVLTYGGVSLFVVVFAVYPFAAELFRRSEIPKRLIPAAIALGAFSFTMDALPGTPQIQNIIPTAFFHTTAWAAPILGLVGSIFILVTGVGYLEWQAVRARKRGEGYGTGHILEPVVSPEAHHVNPAIAVLPLIVVIVCNKLFTSWIPILFGDTATVRLPGLPAPLSVSIPAVSAVWALEGALIIACLLVFTLSFRVLQDRFIEGSKVAVAGALLAAMNTASEYGFGAVIAALPGFLTIRDGLTALPNPLVNVAVVTTALAGITGSASGGLSIALAAMATRFTVMANAAGIPLEVVHRVAAMASGGMDDLPHNGAVITVLAVTGLTHRQSYKDIFVVTLLKTAAVFVVIAVYYATGLV
jgi:H+/gluconate symporter-like permease